MKPSPKLTRGRKKQKNSNEVEPLPERTKEKSPKAGTSKIVTEQPKVRKRRPDKDLAEVPSPPAAKKRRRKKTTKVPNTFSSGSSNEGQESGSSQGESSNENQHSGNLFASGSSNEMESSLSFQNYLKVF